MNHQPSFSESVGSGAEGGRHAKLSLVPGSSLPKGFKNGPMDRLAQECCI